MMDSETDAADAQKQKSVLASKLDQAEQLVLKAKKAAAEAEAAKQKALGLKDSPLGELAATARKYKLEQEAGRLRREAETRAEEASKLAVMADEAEKKRGTTTLAQKLADQSREAILAADEAERKAEAALNGGRRPAFEERKGSRVAPALPFKQVVEVLKKVPLIPSSDARADIGRTTNALDDLKRSGKIGVWDCLDQDLRTAGFRGASSGERLAKAVSLAEGTLDRKLGVNNFKALQLKNYCSGLLMLVGGLGLILAGAVDSQTGEGGGLGRFMVSFGYFALTVNIGVGLLAQQTNDWLSLRMYAADYEGYRDRAILCEAAHLLLAYMCGLPLQEYRREHVGYPLRERPTGRAQIYSARRGDPEVTPRSRSLGLPPWASLESEVPEDSLFDVDSEPVRNGYTSREIDHLSLVLLAGPVAEFLRYGKSSNGAPVFQQLDTCMLMAQTSMQAGQMQGQARWAIIKLAQVLKANEARLAAVEAAMRREDSLVEVLAVIEVTPPDAPTPL